ncbi:MAG: phosphatase PAP2 family protein [Micromonosporaceae bacterium]|nr:phosphatase PAP2 family protein [Micromonosporaceae bacterium]
MLVLAAAQVAAFLLVWRFFVDTEHGQRLDTVALNGNTIGLRHVDELVGSVLNAMSVAALVATTVAIGFIALIRGRVALSVVATVFIAGANASVQFLKYAIQRPDFGVDPERAAAGNSLPSGHAAVAMSFAVALALVLPPRTRGAGAVLGAGYAALVGVATLSAGWHRPSDAVAAMLVVGAWAAAAGFLLVGLQRGHAPHAGEDAHRFAARALALCAVALLVAAAVSLRLTDQVLSTPPDQLSRRRQLVAYAGSAAGIAGTACLVMALVAATVHRVVPRRAS